LNLLALVLYGAIVALSVVVIVLLLALRHGVSLSKVVIIMRLLLHRVAIPCAIILVLRVRHSARWVVILVLSLALVVGLLLGYWLVLRRKLIENLRGLCLALVCVAPFVVVGGEVIQSGRQVILPPR